MHRDLVQSLHTKNPFYLLSALSMLVGCYALSETLGLQAGQWKPLLSLMGVLQVYEFILLALAVFLLRRGRMPADARTAFLVGLLFLVDATYLNLEMATSAPWVAPFVAALQLLALVPKLLWLRDALGLTSRRLLLLTLIQMGLLLYIPGIFSAVHFMDSKVNALGQGRQMLPLVIYGVWWSVGLLPFAHLWIDRRTASKSAPRSTAGLVELGLRYLPFFSILFHLASLHWLYDLPLYGSYLTPLLLGVGTNLAYSLRSLASGWRNALQWGAPVVAFMFSTMHPDVLSFGSEGFLVTPIRVALVGVAFTFWVHRRETGQRTFGWASIIAASLGCSGHSFATMGRTWTTLFPETVAELGVAALVAAFAFLALALAVSLWKPESQRAFGRQTRY